MPRCPTHVQPRHEEREPLSLRLLWHLLVAVLVYRLDWSHPTTGHVVVIRTSRTIPARAIEGINMAARRLGLVVLFLAHEDTADEEPALLTAEDRGAGVDKQGLYLGVPR